MPLPTLGRDLHHRTTAPPHHPPRLLPLHLLTLAPLSSASLRSAAASSPFAFSRPLQSLSVVAFDFDVASPPVGCPAWRRLRLPCPALPSSSACSHGRLWRRRLRLSLRLFSLLAGLSDPAGGGRRRPPPPPLPRPPHCGQPAQRRPPRAHRSGSQGRGAAVPLPPAAASVVAVRRGASAGQRRQPITAVDEEAAAEDADADAGAGAGAGRQPNSRGAQQRSSHSGGRETSEPSINITPPSAIKAPQQLRAVARPMEEHLCLSLLCPSRPSMRPLLPCAVAATQGMAVVKLRCVLCGAVWCVHRVALRCAVWCATPPFWRRPLRLLRR